jgi:DNA repair protein RecO (recombination protein O)
MPLLVAEAIVLHAFDYLESSRIVRLLTREAGMRSALAKGARKSRRRFGSGLDLFAQGTAFLHTKPGRELDTLSGFEDVRPRTELADDLERFAGAEVIAEIALHFGMAGADAELFDAIAAAFDRLAATSGDEAREATLAGAWQLVGALGFGPALRECAECDRSLGEGETALFTHSAGGVLCQRCASLSSGGRKIPWAARIAIAGWMSGEHLNALSESNARAHQRLLREFLSYHLRDGRALRAFDMWEGRSLSATAGAAGDAVGVPTSDADADAENLTASTPHEPVLPGAVGAE